MLKSLSQFEHKINTFRQVLPKVDNSVTKTTFTLWVVTVRPYENSAIIKRGRCVCVCGGGGGGGGGGKL